MAGRGPRTGGDRRAPRHDTRSDAYPDTGPAQDGVRPAAAPAQQHPHPLPDDPDGSLVRIHDLAGRPRGTGFVADHHGTVVTSHEAVDGLQRLVLYAAGDRGCVVTADAVTALPELNLALVRTEGLGTDPLPVTVRDRVETGTYVRLAAGCWREARVLAETPVTYAATDRFHVLDGALELAIGTAGRDALRLGGGAAGGPVLDAATGAVVAVLGTALHSGHQDAGFAVPLRPAPPDGPLAELLARNAATVPAYGADLNPAGVLELTATSVGSDGPVGDPSWTPVERAAPAREFAAFTAGPAAVLGLVGAPGSGRTTELAALAARRGRGARPAPTLWLRGADLRDEDASIADAARRALTRAARIVAASRPVPALGDLSPERLARLAHDAGRPLLLLLDSPEEMPRLLDRRLPEWTGQTAGWLRETGARLVVACRPEYWEQAGALFPADMLHGRTTHTLPPCVPLGDLTPAEAREARARYGIPDTVLGASDARHPLTLRLCAEVRAALPDVPGTPVDRDDVLAAHLDLMCLRVAVRLAAVNGLRGSAVRRLAAKVSGQVHEAARRSLGPGQGELDRASFEAVFPWGPAPARLGGGTGWASAVLAEGLLVPAGGGYRFAHEELADWLQGVHLDLDEALRALVHRSRPQDGERPPPVPHHRIGPVVQALLLVARQQGTPRLAEKLRELLDALETDPQSWWAARLLAETLLRVPDATPYADVLRLLADQVVAWRSLPVRTAAFAPGFWTALALPTRTRLDLLRRLVLADAAPRAADEPRYLDAVAGLLAADPTAVQPLLTRWFDDERPLPAAPHATVATAAQALLHTHRHRALDDLTEALVDCAHPRGDELLAVLAEEAPSALCRAVDRWAHDERPDRRIAAVTHGVRAAAHVRTAADRELLRYAALALLARPADSTLHGGALALLVHDPQTRPRHLPQALERFTAGDPRLPPSALLTALATHPEPVLDAVRARLRGPDAGPVLRALADAAPPDLVRRVVAVVREALQRRPETAGDLAAYVDRRLDRGPAVRAVLFPLVAGLLDCGPEPVRAALATVLAAPGTADSRPLRRELLELLLRHEHDPAVLDAVLRAAVRWSGDERRALVHRTGLLLVRTPDGAARFDRGLVDLSRHVPGFAEQVTGWLTEAPGEWAAVVGPSARRMIENLAGVRVPA
ncbi:trypsin-like peptidase domain-containing protein [Streptomyces sp. NPDC051315]|uniref:trypsin-like peptidase domain-containing protein n=1 Tax=Streptomyces sp. NPDC051315 TaxID=3365650 RepID=UPI0037BCF111